MSPNLSAGKRKLKNIILMAALTLLALSMARPQFGIGLKETRISGRDIIFVLDVSKSMLAQDTAPSRIMSAKAEIAGLLERARGDRMGLVIFAGEAFLQCPLTLDYSAMSLFLDAVKVGSVPLPGTNIADGLKEAIRAFSIAESRSKIIVLLTDGEDHSGMALETAKEAAENNIQIYTVGIGRTGGGAPIPIKNEDGGVVYKKDREGNTVMSALDEETLQKTAIETGGKYYYAGTNLDLSVVYNKIAQKEASASLDDRFYTHYEDRYQWLMLPAILLLFIEAMISERRKSLHRAGSHLKVPLMIILLPFMLGFGGPLVENVEKGNGLYNEGKYGEAIASYTEAQLSDPEDGRLHYNIGTALYKQGKYTEAEEAFRKVLASDDESLKQRAHYNMGNCYFKEGAAAGDIEILTKAVESYEKALELDPGDEDAKYNLEVVRRLIELQKKDDPSQCSREQKEGQQDQEQSQGDNRNEGRDQQTAENETATQEQQLNPTQQSTAEQSAQTQPLQAQPKDVGREEAEQILRALEQRERETLEEQSRPVYGGQGHVSKDW